LQPHPTSGMTEPDTLLIQRWLKAALVC
jgi:hypothetical protein